MAHSTSWSQVLNVPRSQGSQGAVHSTLPSICLTGISPRTKGGPSEIKKTLSSEIPQPFSNVLQDNSLTSEISVPGCSHALRNNTLAVHKVVRKENLNSVRD